MCVRLNENVPDPDVSEPLFVRGDDAWIGRTVAKEFGPHGIFKGQVTDVDDNSKKIGWRVFHVEYEDGDDEWMGAEDLINILVVNIVCYLLHNVLCIVLCFRTTLIKQHLKIISNCIVTEPQQDESDEHEEEHAVPVANARKKKQTKPSKYLDYECAPSDAVYFLFDVETTGSKRNYDKIIAIGCLAYDRQGKLLGCFSRKINPGDISSTYQAGKIHSK